MIYYVSSRGNDSSSGTKDRPFKTINHAAQIAVAGDTVRVFGGVYRETVVPQNGGTSDDCRIVYEAVAGETPIIKGSEVVIGWEHVEGNVWKTVLPNSMFGEFNPFVTKIFGDWMTFPMDYDVHLGDVYLNGASMYEAPDMESLLVAEKRIRWMRFRADLMELDETIGDPDSTVYQWYAQVEDSYTELFCNFGEYDPNRERVEISVRPSCFFPKKTGLNYITVRGFEMAHAATQWAPPTAEQIGMIGPHWAKGWIIENNHFHDAKCSAVSLGKEISTGHNLKSRFRRKSGYQHQMESVFYAIYSAGWNRENIGSHVVRNNVIHDCGQTGIVGHMGCAFSRIEHNHIYNIGRKQEFWGHEIAGIKLHAPIDTVIENNNIHDCSLGIWLDWQVQGTRITKNLFHKNGRDLMIEVTHGPCLVDDNIFLSPIAIQNAAQGTAYVHNLICGKVWSYKVVDRATPYHFAHSTDVKGYAFVYGGDDRLINNIVIGMGPESNFLRHFGNSHSKYSTFDAYQKMMDEQLKPQDHNVIFNVPQPVWVEENAYAGFAKHHKNEIDPIDAKKTRVSLEETDGSWILTLFVSDSLANASCQAVTGERLGKPCISEEPYENSDGTPIDLSCDFVGNKRDNRVIPGPFVSLQEGKNQIFVW